MKAEIFTTVMVPFLIGVIACNVAPRVLEQPTSPTPAPTTVVATDTLVLDTQATKEATPQPPMNAVPTDTPTTGRPAPETGQGAPDLFIPSTTQGDLDRSDDPTIIRTRFVDINFDLLAGAGAPPGSQFGGDVLGLNLFEEVFFTAVLDRLEPRPPDSITWIGHIEGVEHSQVTLVVENETMAGNITLPEEFYQVRYAGNGVYAIYQIDQSAFPPEGEPQLPVAPSPETLVVPVAVEAVEIRHLESLPIQIELVISGNLPDDCEYQLVASEKREGQMVSVTLEGQRPADLACPPAPQPVTHTLLLAGGFAPGDYTLVVNDYQTSFSVEGGE